MLNKFNLQCSCSQYINTSPFSLQGVGYFNTTVYGFGNEEALVIDSRVNQWAISDLRWPAQKMDSLSIKNQWRRTGAVCCQNRFVFQPKEISLEKERWRENQRERKVRQLELSRISTWLLGKRDTGTGEMLSLGSVGAKSTKPSFVSYVTPEVSFHAALYLRCFQNIPETLNWGKTGAESADRHALGGVKSQTDADIVDFFKFRQTGKSQSVFGYVSFTRGNAFTEQQCFFTHLTLHFEVHDWILVFWTCQK